MQKNLLQELRDLQSVLDSEADDAIPVLSDVVEFPPSTDTSLASEQPGTVAVVLDDESSSDDGSIPVPDSETVEAGADSSADQPAESEQSLDQLLAAEATKPAPFALIDSSARDYDSSAAESLIEEGLNEALQSLTEQMDDEALRLVDELVAEHAELIRQELNLRLDAKSKELRAEMAAQRGGEPD